MWHWTLKRALVSSHQSQLAGSNYAFCWHVTEGHECQQRPHEFPIRSHEPRSAQFPRDNTQRLYTACVCSAHKLHIGHVHADSAAWVPTDITHKWLLIHTPQCSILLAAQRSQAVQPSVTNDGSGCTLGDTPDLTVSSVCQLKSQVSSLKRFPACQRWP